MYTLSGSSSNSEEAFCMVYHTFLGQFQPSFSISGPGDGFKKRYAFLMIADLDAPDQADACACMAISTFAWPAGGASSQVLCSSDFATAAPW